MVEYSLFWAGLFDRNITRKGCNLPGMPPDRPAPKETVLHYYPHHIGDFIKETARLTDHQVITYLRLIWIYYESECPLHDDLSVLAMQVGSDEQTISLILRAYFTYQDCKWYQIRCESEIRKYQKKAVSAKAANKARWSNSDMKSDKKSDADYKQDQIATNNQEPITNILDSSKDESLSEQSSDRVPYEQIRNIYHQKLPGLPKCKELNSKRRGQIRARWKAGQLPDLETWSKYFEFIGQSAWLTGKCEPTSGRKHFIADLEWITNETNYTKIIEGKYHG